MCRSLASSVRSLSLAWVCVALPLVCYGRAAQSGSASIEGTVCDAQRYPIEGATVTLESDASAKGIARTTDPGGRFRFHGLTRGTYTLHVKKPSFKETVEGPFAVNESDAKSFTLLLQAAPTQKTSSDMPFSDETNFIVAGVTDTTSLGGHGSDPVRRNSDALSKETAHLSRAGSGTLDEAAIREELSKGDNADLRFQLAEIEERSGRSLAAVNDYQRAAQLDPTEPHYFAWGAELLLHRAFDPSIEVFGKGRKLYPNSVRMILGLGTATYAKSSSDEAKQIFLQACGIDPSDPTPYLFLGRVQATESELPAGWADRLKRFVELEPQNAKAHYYYAVALTKKPMGSLQVALAISQLKTAVELDPQFGGAYLELGILASQQGDLPNAVAYLQKAAQNTTLPDDAHYRLAQVYRRMGDADGARAETELYKQASEKKKQQVEEERQELQQFVYTLREQATSPTNQVPPK